MKIFIMAANFSPGHFSHALALYKALKELGFYPYLFINKGYEKFVNILSESIQVIYIDEYKNEIIPDQIFIQSPSEKNIKYVKLFKKINNSKIIYLYHEPWSGYKSYFYFGNFKRAIRLLLINRLFNRRLVRMSDSIVLPSNKAYLNFQKYEKNNKCLYKLNLLFFNELNQDISIESKKYFSYIGLVCADHGFDEFIYNAKFILNNNKDIKVLIATRSDFKLMPWMEDFIKNERLVIKKGKVLTNNEINECFYQSFCVWNGYKRSTQSGVLPKALMFGACVIYREDAGSFRDYIKHNATGIKLKDDFSINLNNIANCKKNINKNYLECIKAYHDYFDYKNKLNDIRKIFT
jgi:hypothetical protein